MQHLHWSHLLKVWLLLSQLPREIPAQNDDKIIKACGRELVRLRIQICGSISWVGRVHQQVREPRQASEPLAGEHPYPPTPHRLRTSNYWLRAGHQPFRKAPALLAPERLGFPRLALTQVVMPESCVFPCNCFSSKLSPGSSPEVELAAGTTKASPEGHVEPFTSWQSDDLDGERGATEDIGCAKTGSRWDPFRLDPS